MYKWGYIKQAALAKLDLDHDEVEVDKQNLINRFEYFANEAITQISSSVKPKYTYFEVEVDKDTVGTMIRLPDDFVSFGDDKNFISYKDDYGNIVNREAYDEDFVYMGMDSIMCLVPGKYHISYNARWIDTFVGLDDNTELDIPKDILDCLPSYIASQCYKVDDEYKAATFRNEYEIFLARIDDTHFQRNKNFWIEGDW